MASSKYFQNKLLDNFFRGVSYTPPSTYYIGIGTNSTPPSETETSGMIGITEPSNASTGYARRPITKSTSSFTAASGGIISNIPQVTFPEATGSYGTVRYIFIADAASGGNVLWYSLLTTPRIVDIGTTIIIEPNNMQIVNTNLQPE